MAEGKIICAVDFGTTYSGVAYAYQKNGEDASEVDVEIIEDGWPGQSSKSCPKVPSVFKYVSSAPDGFLWGFEVEEDPDRVSFSKLYLDVDQVQTAQTLTKFPAKVGKLPPNRNLKEGIARYLKALRAVAIDRMESDWGEDFVASTPIEYILTVPAVWSDKAKADTLSCAEQAGFGAQARLRLITEPEAAAVYALSSDLTTYCVVATKPSLKLKEVTVGSGGVCGSVCLNRRFEDLVKRRLSACLDKLPRVAAAKIVDEIQKRFNEEVKPAFGHDDRSEFHVEVPSEVPNDELLGVKGGSLILTSAEIHEVFDRVIREILLLIGEQVIHVEEQDDNQQVSSILLVGGFGSSEYLLKQVKAWVKDNDYSIAVLQPVNAWSAVTRRAMLRALQGDIVQSRMIRAHYGVAAYVPWNPAVHESPEFRAQALQNKSWNALEHRWVCRDVMTWYVTKGDVFTNGKVVRFPFYRVKTDLSNMIIESTLHMHTEDGPGPAFLNNECKSHVTLRSDLSNVPVSSFSLQGHREE